MYRLLIIATVLTVITGTPVKKCLNEPNPVEVRVNGCSQQPCRVKKGTSGEFEVDFNIPHNVSSLKTEVLTTALGITVPYVLPDDVADVCKNLKNGQQCPLEAGTQATYKFAFPISRGLPEIKVFVKMSIVDENKNVITCFGVDILVVKH